MREQIEALSARLGADPLLVQGAGGNISWKSGNQLWVKASGMCMRDAQTLDVFVPVSLSATRELERPVVLDPSWNSRTRLRPSIETTLHALLPHTVVVHMHSVALLSQLIVRNCEAHLALLLQDTRHVFIPYCKPGVDLSKAVKHALHARPGVDVLLLANHGIVVGAQTVEAFNARLEELLRSVSAPERDPPASSSIELPVPALNGFRRVADARIHDLALDQCAFDIAKHAWAITPDHVVFLGPKCCVLDSVDAFERSANRGPFVVIRGTGVYIDNAALHRAPQIEEMLRCFRDIVMRIADSREVQSLSDQDVHALLGWEAEQYRQGIGGSGRNID